MANGKWSVRATPARSRWLSAVKYSVTSLRPSDTGVAKLTGNRESSCAPRATGVLPFAERLSAYSARNAVTGLTPSPGARARS